MGRLQSEDRGGAGRAAATACARVLLLFAAAQLTARGAHGVVLQAPAGASNGQVVVVEEQPLAVSCAGVAPLRVAYPLYMGSMPDVRQRTYTDGAGVERWNVSIRVDRALRQHTGFYNCSSDAQPPPESLYVYVRSADGQYPWVKDAADAAKDEIMGQNSAFLQGTAVLDCRPNDPATQVHLVDKAGKQLALGRQSDGADLTWDPRVGFRLGPVAMQHAGAYRCVVDDHHPDLKLKLNVVATSLMAPWVRQDGGGGGGGGGGGSGGWVSAGEDVSLVCDLAVARRVNFSLSWRGPRGDAPRNDGSRWEYFGNANEQHAWHRRGRTVFINRASANEAGEYVCTAEDDHGNKRSTSYKLEVRGGESATSKPGNSSNNPTHRPLSHRATSGGKGVLTVHSTALLTITIGLVLRN